MGYNRELRLGAVGDVLRWRVLLLSRRRGLTREHLSRRLRALGVTLSAASLREIENGTRRVTVDELVGLATVLEMDAGQLLISTPRAETSRMSELEFMSDRALRSALAKASATEEDLEGNFRRWLSIGQFAKLGLKQRYPESLLTELEAVRVDRDRMEVEQERRDRVKSDSEWGREKMEIDQETARLQAIADDRTVRGEYGDSPESPAYIAAERRIAASEESDGKR